MPDSEQTLGLPSEGDASRKGIPSAVDYDDGASTAEMTAPLSFDIITPATDGYIAAPLSVVSLGRETIEGIMPGEWNFVSAGSVQIDERSRRVSIDLDDDLPDGPTTLNNLESRAAVMRVFRGIGAAGLNGFVIDYRRIQTHVLNDRGLEEGVTSPEFMLVQAHHKAELPLGVVFQELDRVHYIGHPDAATDALSLAMQVDDYVHQLEDADQI